MIVTDSVIPLPAQQDDHSAAPQDALEQRRPRTGHFAWIDVRGLAAGEREAIIQAALHHRVDGILSDDADVLASLPPTVRRVLVTQPGLEQDLGQDGGARLGTLSSPAVPSDLEGLGHGRITLLSWNNEFCISLADIREENNVIRGNNQTISGGGNPRKAAR